MIERILADKALPDLAGRVVCIAVSSKGCGLAVSIVFFGGEELAASPTLLYSTQNRPQGLR
jgi:hypothetical protein